MVEDEEVQEEEEDGRLHLSTHSDDDERNSNREAAP